MQVTCVPSHQTSFHYFHFKLIPNIRGAELLQISNLKTLHNLGILKSLQCLTIRRR